MQEPCWSVDHFGPREVYLGAAVPAKSCGHTWWSKHAEALRTARGALALYREGRNAEETALVSYAVLSYFKIIEIRYHDGPKAKKWIASNVAVVNASADDDPELKQFLAVCGSKAPEEYIYTACRLAVAHASIKRLPDADDVEEISRLHSASYVLRLLARLMISQELGVSDQVYSGD